MFIVDCGRKKVTMLKGVHVGNMNVVTHCTSLRNIPCSQCYVTEILAMLPQKLLHDKTDYILITSDITT